MANTFFSRLIGSRNQRVLNRKRKFADQVNALESSISTLDDAALQAKTTEFRGRLNQGESLDALLPEAFAVIR